MDYLIVLLDVEYLKVLSMTTFAMQVVRKTYSISKFVVNFDKFSSINCNSSSFKETLNLFYKGCFTKTF